MEWKRRRARDARMRLTEKEFETGRLQLNFGLSCLPAVSLHGSPRMIPYRASHPGTARPS